MKPLSSLLFPQKALVFIGGAECATAITKTRALGFKGKIWAVHPTRDEIGGVKAVRSLDEVNGDVDAAFIAVKREVTIAQVAKLQARRCGGAIIYASGFAETGDVHFQEALLAAAGAMPLLGPNCYGYVNGIAGVALWPDEHGIKPLARGVAIITQSGNIACNFTITQRGLPLAAVFTLGNQADVDMADMVEALCTDPRITAIGLHIEGLPNVQHFAAAAALGWEARKPIVVLKTGRSTQGAKVTMSHTSSLAGADQLYDALFERYGIARVNTPTAFVETLKLLHGGGPMTGRRIVSLSCSGGEAALIADLAPKHDLQLPAFPDERREHIGATLNAFVTVDNPLDYHTFIWGDEAKLRATFSAVLASGYDAGLLVLDTPVNAALNAAPWRKTADAFMQAAEITGARACLLATFPEGMPEDLADEAMARGITPLIGFDDALTALAAAATIGENYQRGMLPPPLKKITASAGEPRLMGEHQAKSLLESKYHLPIPRGEVCVIAEAAQVANRLGFPVVMKTARLIAHKSEVGGVILNIRSISEAEAAAQKLAILGPEVLVEKMITGAVTELIIGVARDGQFGLSLVIGAGGVFTELLRDSISLLLPTSHEEISRALTRLKIWPLFSGFRGRSGDVEAVVKAIESIAQFAADHAGDLEELDVNPLLVLENGAVAVDCLIRIRSDRYEP